MPDPAPVGARGSGAVDVERLTDDSCRSGDSGYAAVRTTVHELGTVAIVNGCWLPRCSAPRVQRMMPYYPDSRQPQRNTGHCSNVIASIQAPCATS